MEKRFYLRIGDSCDCEEHWFETEEQLKEFIASMDTIGISVFAVEVNKIIYNM